MSYDIKLGNTQPAIAAQLKNKAGIPIDLTVGSPVVDLTLRKPSGTVLTIDGITLGDPGDPLKTAALGWVSHIWALVEVDEVGDYIAEFDETSTLRTFPSRDVVYFTVHPKIATDTPSAINWGQVGAFAPELACLTGAVTQAILTHVNTTFSAKYFQGGETGSRLKLARINLAAHYGTIHFREDAQGGPINSEKVDEVEIRYAAFSTGDPLLGRTPYGLTVKGLIRTSKARGPFVV